jgi:hypothetical protein
VSLAFWLDLRGYGAMLNRANFDPTCRDAKAAVGRLHCFQEVVSRHSRTTFPTLVINDGAVAYRDIGMTRTDRALPFIERCWDLFQAATAGDAAAGRKGNLRGVLAAGLRAKGSNRGILAQNTAMTEIIVALAGGRLSLDEAKRAVWRVRRVQDIVPQLQANFAFSRAYTAEQGARTDAAKLAGPHFYLETRLLREGVPDWMQVGEPIDWEPQAEWLSTLSTTFVQVRAIDRSAEYREHAIRTGREMLSLLSYNGERGGQ